MTDLIESRRRAFRVILTNYLDYLFLQNFTLQDLIKLDQLFDLKLGRKYFDCQLEIFLCKYHVNSEDVSEANLKKIKQADNALRMKGIHPIVILLNTPSVTKNKLTGDLQSINGQPAVVRIDDNFAAMRIDNRSATVELRYYFINNNIICSQNIPGIIYTPAYYREKRIFFAMGSLDYKELSVFKILTITRDRTYCEYFDITGVKTWTSEVNDNSSEK